MSLFERDSRKHANPPGDPERDLASDSGSNSDAEESAAHIAGLVRRTAERLAAPSPSCVPRPGVTAAMKPPAPPAPEARPVASPVSQPLAAGRSRHPLRRPALRTLVVGGAVAAVLVVGALALSIPDSSDAGPAQPSAQSSAPAGYAVKVTDEITDCASHSHGRTKNVFETQNCVRATRSLATGRVSGHPTLFVVSRIQMASVEQAATVKQVLDATGTGNLNDLLREGRTFVGAPAKMPSSGYASVQTGTVILVAEAGFFDGRPSSNTNPALRAAASQVASLTTAAS